MFAFNRLVRLRNQVRTAWADIDVTAALPRSGAVAGDGGAGLRWHESATLRAVLELRAAGAGVKRSSPGSARSKPAGTRTGRLIAPRSPIPTLANQNFEQLQRDLVQVEEQLQYARRFYNGAVRDYNDASQRVPDVAIASARSASPAEFFQAEACSRDAVKVEMAP